MRKSIKIVDSYYEVMPVENIVNDALPDYKTRQTQLERLCARYRFISRTEAGRSVLGRSIPALRIGEPEDAVLLAGAFHAQEWLTAALLLRFAERLSEALDCGGLLADIDCRRAMLGRGVVILPCVNPDGVETALNGIQSAGDLAGEVERISGGDIGEWNANARGVDLNHNFNAGWHIARQLEQAAGITGPAPRRFGGLSPESEPETQAVVSLCERFGFRCVYAFHSQGEEIYWRYGAYTPGRSALMAQVLAASSGYAVSQPEGIASHAGFKDWFIEHYHRPGFTIEIGRGKNPLPMTALDGIYTQLEEMLMLAVVM